MTKKLYSLTDEHRAQLKPWADQWIANAMSTKKMSEDDRIKCTDAVGRFYAAANLPAPKHIVFVPSPLVLRLASGFAAAIWHKHKNDATYDATSAATSAATSDATYDATYDATSDATYDATDAATYAATYDATYAATRDATDAATSDATYDATDDATDDATYDATYAATRDATDAATSDATYDATDDATDDATYDATDDATDDATSAATRAATYDATRAADLSHWYVVGVNAVELAKRLGVGNFGLQCALSAWRMWQGGNQWSAWDSFLSFFRHVAKLPIDYSKYDAWEILAKHSGPRIMHPDFCMISDRPEVLTVDEQNRPHSFSGPFCKWRDGFALYSVHGVRLPAWIIERPQEITVEKIDAEPNAEIRRVMVERFGLSNYMQQSGAKVVHELPTNYYLKGLQGARLLRKEQRDDEAIITIHVKNSTPEPDGSIKDYFLRVDPNAYGGKASIDCHAAMASTWRFEDGSMVFKKPADYSPSVET